MSKICCDIFWIFQLCRIFHQDYKKKEISDSDILWIGVCALIRMLLLNHGISLDFLAGIVVPFFLFFLILLCAPGSFGGGDIKLCMANGCYLGVKLWFQSFTLAVLFAAIAILGLFCREKNLRKKEIAFGPFLCLGAVVVKIAEYVL